MLRYSIAEFFGHTLIGFTRSVTERYNFDKDENRSELFGFNALHDTGKEWYTQPVDEVIYQEFSNSEATAWDYLRTISDTRLIDACSTQDNEQTQAEHEDRAVAWKRLRPKIFRTLWSSLYFL